MMKVEFEFQTPEEAAAAMQAIVALRQSPFPTPAPRANSAPAPTAATPPPETDTAPPGVPVTAAPAYTREQIMTAGAALIDTGKMDELMTLLSAFGVQAVTQLKQEQLGAFATELRKLGAQI
jgi:hypothetical protein